MYVLKHKSITALLEPLHSNRKQYKRKNVFEKHPKNYCLVLFYLQVNWSIPKAIYIVSYIYNVFSEC